MWKPKAWIAALLCFFFFPFGMFYVGRPRLVFAYLGLVLAAGVGAYLLHVTPPIRDYILFAVMLGCIVHAIHISRRAPVVSERPWFTKWYGLVASYLLLVLPLVVARGFFFEPFHLPSMSMAPGLPNGSYVVISKFGFGNYGVYGIQLPYVRRSETVRRGDVLVFRNPEDEEVSFVKRVVAVGGDKVEYRNKRLYVNGVKVTDEPYAFRDRYEYATESMDAGKHEVMLLPMARSRDFAMEIPPDNYFMMGDNRDNSRDSRHWGPVPEELLVGRVVWALQ